MVAIQECVSEETDIIDALHLMKDYRYWAKNTIDGYVTDVKAFEEFLMDMELDATLENGANLEVVNRWIKQQKENGAVYKTITRRIASLSTIYSFYLNLGIVENNVFKAVQVPGSHTGSFCRLIDMEELKEVYSAIHDLKKDGIDVDIPLKILIYTGLRNHALSALKVGDINWEQEVLVYNEGIDNNKHKIQFLPIPPVFLKQLEKYIDEQHLSQEDPLCYGLKGHPLREKQLNRITDKLCECLDWKNEEKITPHGFRYCIATLLDEKGVKLENIQFLLGHTSSETIKQYIKRHKRKIHQIRNALTDIEKELEEHLHGSHETQVEHQQKIENQQMDKHQDNNAPNTTLPYSEEFLLELSDRNPDMFLQVMREFHNKNNLL
ncbi:tyrosine-type recombinase/integrase [Alteribacillus sp. JSM 102045]|uniref:tyrosine-type recombinase/integrase n=1 Tax=Alteribacillus sp. JSM 102045 TaxID=1562101 RepID=UPI0035C162A3